VEEAVLAACEVQPEDPCPTTPVTMEGTAMRAPGYFEVSLSNASESLLPAGVFEAHLETAAENQSPDSDALLPSLNLGDLHDEPHSPLESVAGCNVDMQMVRKLPDPSAGDMTTTEKHVVARMKEFCSRILKALAPPLLQEVESMTSLRANAEPFTPRRSVRFTSTATPARPGKQPKKASAAESALLKALGINPEGLTAGKDAIQELKDFFDSPVRDQQLHVLAAIFGKTMPARRELESLSSLEICASA
jgi:hypothetical protein